MTAISLPLASARTRVARAGLLLALLLVLAGAFFAARAMAWSSTNCSVNASGGYINCLSYTAPSYETVKANHLAGTGFSFRLYRPSDGAAWGPWAYGYGDMNYHAAGVSVSGLIVTQVDNQGTANPASYYVEMA